MEGEKKKAYAALDIGTSQVKLGVYCPSVSDRIVLINNLPNEVIHGAPGEVQIDYRKTREASFLLLEELGRYLKQYGIEMLYLGICGHISSLVEWDRTDGKPLEKLVPIWLDTTCYNSLDEYRSIMGEGRSKDIIGTFLPAGTNWLFTKLLHRMRSGFNPKSIFLQVGDAVFYELTGEYATHFSSQLSLVDLRKKEYAQSLLDYLQLNQTSLPAIASQSLPIQDRVKTLLGLPGESYVFPAMADLYASLYGLRLQNNEGFMLANTSEQAGAFFLSKPVMPDNFLSIAFHPGFINYGSTNTGGNIVHWFLSSVLNKKPTQTLFEELTTKATSIKSCETPVVLPYLQGERAPLWNSKLTATILELNASHTAVHLFRAILESIAFARRQCFEQLGLDALNVIKLGGGSSKNGLWNEIRATVLNKPIAVADEKELSIAGLLYSVMDISANVEAKPVVNFLIIEPDPSQTAVYQEKYQRFIHYQNLLSC